MENKSWVTRNLILFWTLSALPLVAAVLLLPLFPDQIPAHYGLDGVVDRWGSKYEILITPISTLGVAALLIAIQKASQRMKSYNPQNEKSFAVSLIAFLLLFWVLNIYIFYTSYTKTEDIMQTGMDMMRLLAVIMGIVFILIGNVLPKCKQNMLIGIRTKWTLENEQVWYKTHRMGGVLFVAAGCAVIVLNLFLFQSFASLICLLAALAVLTAACAIYSAALYKKETQV
jgi:uncharacterized membrane protein